MMRRVRPLVVVCGTVVHEETLQGLRHLSFINIIHPAVIDIDMTVLVYEC